MMRSLKLGGASLNQIPMDWVHNLTNIKTAIALAQQHESNILCLPELCITGYGCEDMFLSDWIPEQAMESLLELVPCCNDLLTLIGLPVIFEQAVYNCTAIVVDGELKGFYAKQKLANDGVHYEPRWFTPWPSGKVTEIEVAGKTYPIGQVSTHYHGIHIGYEICEDAWRKDRPGLHPINQNIDLILNPSASHFAFKKALFRENLVIESSKQLNCVYCYTNLLGNEAGRMIFDGDIIMAQHGKLLARNKRLSYQDVDFLSILVNFDDPKQSETHLEEDHKEAIHEFGRAASLALFDYLRKSHSQGFVLSLSGGADSSSIAILVSEMVRLGIEELGFEAFKQKLNLPLKNGTCQEIVGQLFHTAYQGTKNSSQDTFKSAQTLANSLGARFYHWEIDEQVGSYTQTIEKAIGRPLTWEQDDVTLQNIQARSRSPIIWMIANMYNCLLLSTSNRSEGDVGYTTMDGDTSGSISPIAAVDKYFILKWLRFAEKELGYSGLQLVNRLTPTAELRPLENDQTDEKDLMPYEVLLAIEEQAIRDKKSPLAVYNSLKKKWTDKELLKVWITKFYSLWSRNQWKRERLAPSFHLDDFNVDPRTWCRFPILSSGFKQELEKLKQQP